MLFWARVLHRLAASSAGFLLVIVAFLGGTLGVLGGLGYAKAMLRGWATIWRDAVGASALQFHAAPQSLAVGGAASVAAAARGGRSPELLAHKAPQ